MKGEELRKARIVACLTQKKLGLLIGYDEKSAERVIQLWEHDKQPIPTKYWRKLSDVLGIPLEKFIP